MKRKVLVELLDEQATELQRGKDPTAEMQATFGHESPTVTDLLGLARRLWRAMPQVEPGAEFVTGLKTRLRQQFPVPASPPTVLSDPRERRLLLVAASLGTLVYLASIAAFSIRMLVYGLSLVALLLGLRKSTLEGRNRQSPAI